MIVDYLDNSFNETQEIKRILYEYIVNQSGVKVVKDIKSKKKVIKEGKCKSKVVEDSESDKKSLTNSNNDTKVIKNNNNDTKKAEAANNDDFQLDLTTFTDEVVEVKKDKSELKTKKLNALKQFL